MTWEYQLTTNELSVAHVNKLEKYDNKIIAFQKKKKKHFISSSILT